jgi:hypothetical protein
MTDIGTNIKNILHDVTYSEKYSIDILITTSIILITFGIVFYVVIVNNIKNRNTAWYSSDKETQFQTRCNIDGVLFSNIITNNDANWNPTSTLQWCMEEALKPGTNVNFKPFSDQFSILNDIFQFLYSIVIWIYSFFVMLYNYLIKIFTMIMNAIHGFLLEIYYLFLLFNDTISKLLGMGNVFYYIIQQIVKYLVLFIYGIRNLLAQYVYTPIFQIQKFVTEKYVLFITVLLLIIMGAILVVAGTGFVIAGPVIILIILPIIIILAISLQQMDPILCGLNRMVFSEIPKMDSTILGLADNIQEDLGLKGKDKLDIPQPLGEIYNNFTDYIDGNTNISELQ